MESWRCPGGRLRPELTHQRGQDEDSSASQAAVPDSCQIMRGTTGNTGEPADNPPRIDCAAPQVTRAPTPRSPQLPKLSASCDPGWRGRNAATVPAEARTVSTA